MPSTESDSQSVLGNYFNSELKQNVELGNGVVALTKGKTVVETPEWQFGGRVDLEFGPVEFGFEGKYVDDRFATDVNDVVVPSYAMFDLDTRLNLDDFGLDKTYLQLNVKNVFDTYWISSISSQIAASNKSCNVTAGCSTSQPSFTIGYPRTVSASIHFEF